MWGLMGCGAGRAGNQEEEATNSKPTNARQRAGLTDWERRLSTSTRQKGEHLNNEFESSKHPAELKVSNAASFD